MWSLRTDADIIVHRKQNGNAGAFSEDLVPVLQPRGPMSCYWLLRGTSARAPAQGPDELLGAFSADPMPVLQPRGPDEPLGVFCEDPVPVLQFRAPAQGAQMSLSQPLLNYMGSFFTHNSLMYSKLHCGQLCLTHTLPCSTVLGATW